MSGGDKPHWSYSERDSTWDFYESEGKMFLFAFVAIGSSTKPLPYHARFMQSSVLAADRDFATLDEAKVYVETIYALTLEQ